MDLFDFARTMYLETLDLFNYDSNVPLVYVFSKNAVFKNLLTGESLGKDKYTLENIVEDENRAVTYSIGKDVKLIYVPNNNDTLENRVTLAEEIFHAIDNLGEDRKTRETFAMFGRYLALRELGLSKEMLGDTKFLELVTGYNVRKEDDKYIFIGSADEDKYYNGRIDGDLLYFIDSLEEVDSLYAVKKLISAKMSGLQNIKK